MKRWCRPPLQHPLAPAFARAVESLSTALSSSTTRNYNIAVRNFLVYLAADHPEVTSLDQLRRDPHALGWMSRMRAQIPPLATATCIARLIALRAVFNELAWTSKLPELAHLLRREDIPAHRRVCHGRLPQCRINCYSKSAFAATTWAETSSYYSATPACASANALTYLMTACDLPVLISGLFMSA